MAKDHPICSETCLLQSPVGHKQNGLLLIFYYREVKIAEISHPCPQNTPSGSQIADATWEIAWGGSV